MQFFPGKKKIEGCLRAIRIWCFVFIDKSIRILTVVEAPPFEHRVTLNFINFPQIGGPSNLKRARFESTGCFKWIFTSWLTSFHLSPRRIVLNVFHTVFVLLFFFFLSIQYADILKITNLKQTWQIQDQLKYPSLNEIPDEAWWINYYLNTWII